tara:strand:- start:1283 stop:1648 length:366 start_codon:yes stop_codon:yes gene_type:complete
MNPDDIRRLASFPEQNPDPTLEIDEAGRITYINPAALKRFPDLPQAGLRHVFFAGLEAELEKLRHGGEQTYAREHQAGDFIYDQKLTWVPGSRLVRVYAHDITERKRAEEATQRAQSQLIE